MNKEKYLESLDHLLSTLPYSERRDIMYDYETHFDNALEEGKSESEIIKSLEKPEKIAAKYLGIKSADLIKESKVPAARTSVKPQKVSQPQVQQTPTTVGQVKKANHVLVIILMSIVMLTLTSILLSPYIVFWVIPIIIFSFAMVGLFGGFTLLISSLVSVPLSVFNIQIIAASHPIFLIAFSISSIALGGLLMILTFYMSKGLAYLAVYYVKWCFRAIRGY